MMGNGESRRVPAERFLLRAVGRTDVGAQRTQNEDAMYYDDFLGVYIVCDGMGGHASGQVASDIAIRTIVHSLKTGEPIEASKEYTVAGWASINEATEGPAIWDVVEEFLARNPVVTVEENRSVKVESRKI